MTTIAWDGKTLAGDKKCELDGSCTRCVKVFKITCAPHGTPALVGCAGASADCVAVVEWLKDTSKIKPEVTSLSALFVVPTQRGAWAFWLAEALVMVPLCKGAFAIGSGGAHALGAMAAGKSARDAVMIASKLDRSTGLGVDVVKL
ncbi:MAG: hypothetical protein Q7J84_10510 [Sulfuricaulis sp.]|nr:hypothetical protein [Sulfuricaulis sp.]